MDAASTTVIEIDVVYKNKTGNGPKETANDINRIKRALDDADRAGGRTRKSIEKIGSVLGNLARKTITIPIKIMDYATRPLRGLLQFATGIKGILTGLVVGKIGQEAIGKPLGLADAYTGAFTGFSTLFKDIEKGKQMMNSLDQFARTTPFKTSNVTAQTQKMMSMGWNPENLIQDMTIIGDAVSAILAGMERDYGGMMEKMSRETVSGIRSNIADTLEINVFRKWGQGLQDGAKRGLGAVADMLDKNQEKLSKFGDQAKIVAASISDQFADAAANVAIATAPTGATFLSKVGSKVKAVSALGVGGTAGAAVGVTGLISAINDFVVAASVVSHSHRTEASIRSCSDNEMVFLSWSRRRSIGRFGFVVYAFSRSRSAFFLTNWFTDDKL